MRIKDGRNFIFYFIKSFLTLGVVYFTYYIFTYFPTYNRRNESPRSLRDRFCKLCALLKAREPDGSKYVDLPDHFFQCAMAALFADCVYNSFGVNRKKNIHVGLWTFPRLPNFHFAGYGASCSVIVTCEEDEFPYLFLSELLKDNLSSLFGALEFNHSMNPDLLYKTWAYFNHSISTQNLCTIAMFFESIEQQDEILISHIFEWYGIEVDDSSSQNLFDPIEYFELDTYLANNSVEKMAFPQADEILKDSKLSKALSPAQRYHLSGYRTEFGDALSSKILKASRPFVRENVKPPEQMLPKTSVEQPIIQQVKFPEVPSQTDYNVKKCTQRMWAKEFEQGQTDSMITMNDQNQTSAERQEPGIEFFNR